MRKLLIFVLTAALMAGLCMAPAAARFTDFFDVFPEDVPETALVRSAPNDTVFSAAVTAFQLAVRDGTESDEDMVLQLNAMSAAYNKLDTAYVACMLAYYRNPGSCSDDYITWSSLYNTDTNKLVAALQGGLNSKYKDAVRQALGDETADWLLNRSVDTQEQLDLLSRCDVLVNSYWSGMKADYTVNVDGTPCTSAQLEALYAGGKLPYSSYISASAKIEKQKNAAVTPILASLVTLRNQYAVSKGYKNYAEYAYPNVYGRDYTTAEAAQFEADVKKYVSPILKSSSNILYFNGDLSADNLSGLENLTQKQVLNLVQPYMVNVSSEYAELFDYMVRNGLCDLNPASTKLSVGFTTAIGEYHSAYIFNCPSSGADDVKTLIHEFGHYAQDCLDLNSTTSYDVAEINSQGLEALYLKYADGIAGDKGGDAYRAATAADLLYAVVTGCLYDEFQQKLYEDGNMTTDEMNGLFHVLAAGYGLNYGLDGESYSWVEVSHTFEDPMYYISYATSAATALELLDLSQSNYDAAADKYLQLTADSGDYAYRALVAKEGLTDVFTAGGIAGIADGVLRYLENEAADVPEYTDLSGHWFEKGAGLVSACGLMHGDGTAFDPNGKTTRAMFVTVLYRAFGGGAKAKSAPFTDVSDPSAWYYDAVNWAAEQGIVKGYGGKFRPGDNITRQDMAVILIAAMGGSGAAADERFLNSYADQASIADYARTAVALCTAAGIMKGSGGRFAPGADATRAEMGQVYINLTEAASAGQYT